MVKRKRKIKMPITKKFAIGIIITSTCLVLLSVFMWFFFQPDKVAERELRYLAKDYYETYYYPQLSANGASESLEQYSEDGLPKVKLRQLLLFDNQRHADSAKAFSHGKYSCDTSNTYIKYYPVSPFGAKDYRVEYNYACKNL